MQSVPISFRHLPQASPPSLAEPEIPVGLNSSPPSPSHLTCCQVQKFLPAKPVWNLPPNPGTTPSFLDLHHGSFTASVLVFLQSMLHVQPEGSCSV